MVFFSFLFAFFFFNFVNGENEERFVLTGTSSGRGSRQASDVVIGGHTSRLERFFTEFFYRVFMAEKATGVGSSSSSRGRS